MTTPTLLRLLSTMRLQLIVLLCLVGHLFQPICCVFAGSPPQSHPAPNETQTEHVDVVIYGGTSAAITAAVQTKRMGHSVVIVSPEMHLGGLSSGGLGWTDSGNKSVIGGLSREFYHRVWQYYQAPDAWKWERREDYGNQGQGTVAIDGAQRTQWIFEPHVAEFVFDQWVAEEGITVHRDQWLDREKGVTVKEGRIQSIRTLSGMEFQGKMFVDATYEGDLLAAAGVSYHVGREANSQYDEQWNGIQVGVLHHGHHFDRVPQKISAYKIPGEPSSGLLPKISPDPPGEYGQADHRVQAYCFRMCLTNDPRNRTPFPKPEGYDPADYELLRRILVAGWREGFQKFDPIPNHKTDTNNHGPFSTDNIGANYEYPEASYEQRKAIIDEHRRYQQGLMYFLSNDPNIPADVRKTFSQWGLAADEFVDNGNWPHQIYVREARRMIGTYVMTENELLKKRPTPQSIGMGSYVMDSHNVQRYVTPEGYVQNEGDIGVSTRGPYQIAWGSILPKKDECENLVVPVCVSSSHIAFGSIRMEPVFMILGQSAATTAVMALEAETAVQDLPYENLRNRLTDDGQVLEFTPPPTSTLGISKNTLNGIVLDDDQAKLDGPWHESTSSKFFVGREYLHEGHTSDGRSTALFSPQLEPGLYDVRVAYSPGGNRATNVPILITHQDGQTTVLIDQTKTPPLDKLFVSVGKFRCSSSQSLTVRISNDKTDGHVVVDAVQLIPLDKQ